MSYESKRRSTSFLSESRLMSDESKRRSTGYLSESRLMSDESKRRSTGFLSESRSMSDESKRRSTSFLSESRSMSDESKRRSTSFLSESRSMSDESKRRSTSLLSENRSMSYESKRRSTSFLSESRLMSDESKRRSTGFLSESRLMSDESKRRSTGFLSESRSMSDESKRRSTSTVSKARYTSSESKNHSPGGLSKSRSPSCGSENRSRSKGPKNNALSRGSENRSPSKGRKSGSPSHGVRCVSTKRRVGSLYISSSEEEEENFKISKKSKQNSSSSREQQEYSGTGSNCSTNSRYCQREQRQNHSRSVHLSPIAARSNEISQCSSSCPSQNELKGLLAEVRSLSKIVIKNQHVNDRRLTRMEVSINKALVRLGDMTRSNAAGSINNVSRVHHTRRYSHEDSGSHHSHGDSRNRHSRGDSRSEEREHRRGGRGRNDLRPRPQTHTNDSPEMPIRSLNKLGDADHQLKNREFFASFVNDEIEFCTPSKNSTHTGVITTYLKRFVTVRVRSLLTLKELKKGEGFTLYSDFHNVYKFLITVMREAYKSCKRSLTEKEAHEALRIVWGRSKQLFNDEQKRQ